jgi:hypothetical protein
MASNTFSFVLQGKLAVGNAGIFTEATPEEPVVLLANDFNKNGKIDPVMGHYLQKKLVPAHPRENLNLQIIGFRKKYVTYKDYSEALFDDLFTSKEIKGAIRKEAKELRSCIAINDKKGNFNIDALPWEVQQSPVSSFLIEDYNKDGFLDLICTGNFYSNEAHQGRQDASRGTILMGNGKGNFKVLNYQTSGLNIVGDVRKSLYFKNAGLLLTFINSGKVNSYKLKTK